jgi:hypothetical protein
MRRFIFQRVESLGDSISHITEGYLDTNIPKKEDDELGALEEGVYNMRESIKRQILEIAQSEEKYRLIAQYKGQITYEYNISTKKLILANSKLNGCSFLNNGKKYATVPEWLENVHPKDKKSYKNFLKSVLKEKKVPLSIFPNKIGALEAIVKYLKENIKMNYSEIAELLNRDDRTIWTVYQRALKKGDKK